MIEVPIWVQGLLIAVLAAVKLLWGVDLLVAYVIRRRGQWQRGAVALGVFNLASSVLYVITAWSWLHMPEQMRPAWTALILGSMTATAIMAWLWLGEQEDRS